MENGIKVFKLSELILPSGRGNDYPCVPCVAFHAQVVRYVYWCNDVFTLVDFMFERPERKSTCRDCYGWCALRSTSGDGYKGHWVGQLSFYLSLESSSQIGEFGQYRV